MNNKVLEAKINEKWIPRIKKVLEEREHKLQRFDERKLRKIAQLANTRMIYENATLNNVNGRGGINFGNNPNTGVSGFYGGPKGSAEVFSNLFGIFIETVANCIAFDLFPLVPMTKSSGTIYIAEPLYAGGKLDNADNKPLMIHVKQTKNGAQAALTIGTTYTLKTANSGGENIADVIYVGQHRLNGNFVFRIGQQYDNTGGGGTNWKDANVQDLFDSATNGSGIYTNATDYWSFTADTVDFVAGFTNFVAGFSGAGLNDTDAWFLNRGDGKRYGQAMSRQTGEKTYYRSMGIRTWSRNFEADTVHTDIEYTTEQIQDMQMDHGLNASEFGDSILTDQLTQHINEHLLGRAFALGWSHHYQMNQANGFNMNAFIASSATTGAAQAFLGKDNTLLTIAGAAGVLPSAGAIAENLSSLQRRIITRLFYGSGIINQRSRRGRGDNAVMNVTFSTAVRDIRAYQLSPFVNDLNDGNVANIGSLYGINIFEDPLMDIMDQRICVMRKGNEKDPGIKFCPYLLAEKISTIAEGTMAPKEALKSRYQVVEAGTNPELNYLSFTVEQGAGYSLV